MTENYEITAGVSSRTHLGAAPRSRRSGLILAVVIAGALTGCAANVAQPKLSAPEPELVVPSTGTEAWPTVDEAGAGETTVTIPNPSSDAFYLNAEFACTTGDYWLELAEDSRVFMAGTCGGPTGYQMPLPTESPQYTFTIELDPDAAFTFTGKFQAAGG